MKLEQLTLETASKQISLPSLWQDQPLLMVLLRHTGCPICREHLVVTEGMLDQLQQRGIRVVGVAQASGKEAEALREELSLGFSVLGDPGNQLYRALAMPRGSWWQVTFGPLLRQPIRGLRRLKDVRKPGRDVRQLGGVVLLDERGEVRYRFCQRDSADLPEEAEVLKAAENLVS